jgi:DNA-binding transcriptional ArsR family regulator
MLVPAANMGRVASKSVNSTLRKGQVTLSGVDAFEALAHPDRRALLELLAQKGRSAGELAAEFDVTRPAISWQLRVLLGAGLVRVRQDGRRRLYDVEPEGFAQIERWLGARRAFWEQRLDALETQIRRSRRQERDPAAKRPAA